MLEPDRDLLRSCCASAAWVALVSAAAPYRDLDELLATAHRAWLSLGRDDWCEALAAHPRAGAGVTELAELTARYERRLGTAYVVCALGRSEPELLALLRARLAAEPADELVTAAHEQWRITELGLRAAYG